MDGVREAVRAGVGAEQVDQQLADRVGPERGERDLPHVRARHPLGAVLGAVVHDEQAVRAGDRVHPVPQPRLAGAVEPVQVLDEDQPRALRRRLLQQAARHAGELAVAQFGVHARGRLRRIGDAEKVE